MNADIDKAKTASDKKVADAKKAEKIKLAKERYVAKKNAEKSFDLNKETCKTLRGGWTFAASDTVGFCKIAGSSTLKKGETMNIPAGVTLLFNVNGDLKNYGTITINSGSIKLTSVGRITNHGTITINSGSIYNSGTITNNGTINIFAGNGIYSDHQTIINNGKIIVNNSERYYYGINTWAGIKMKMFDDGIDFNRRGGNIYNYGTITISNSVGSGIYNVAAIFGSGTLCGTGSINYEPYPIPTCK